jgi:alkanesulfonate monooxygenase SsuD/methylene tetrahydromethanopterin reductase-like flavin-dependent oxidoreductase (luciferase family)
VPRTGAHPWSYGRDDIRFGVAGGPIGDWLVLRDFVQMAEALGLDSYWRADHPLLMPDCWTILAAVAACTRSIRVGSMVSCATYRHPLLLARIVGDVDAISGGRAVLGVGVGDLDLELGVLGRNTAARARRSRALREVLATVPRLLRGEGVSALELQAFAGADATLDGRAQPAGPRDGIAGFLDDMFESDGFRLLPPPPQQPHIPLVIGGGGERETLRLVAEHADASNLLPGMLRDSTLDEAEGVRRKHAVLDQHCRALSKPCQSVLRTFQLIPVVLADSAAAVEVKRQQFPPNLFAFAGSSALVGTPEQAVERCRKLIAVGCQYFIMTILEPESLQLLVNRVIPAIASECSAS